MPISIDLYYDCVSPYSWLAFEVLTRYKDIWGIELNLKPVFLGGIMQATGNKPPAMVPAKGKYMQKDLQRARRHYSVPLRAPDAFGKLMFQSLKFMRVLMAVGVRAPESLEAVTRECWLKVWSRNEGDLSPEWFESLLSNAGIPSEKIPALLQAANDADVKDQLKQNTQAAIKTGAFGAPTIVVTEGSRKEKFFGSDRFPIIASEFGLRWDGPNPNHSKL